MKAFCFLSTIVILIFSNKAWALENPMLTSANNCSDLACVRNNIDIIDAEIVKLISLRLTHVKKAGELKQGKQAIHDPARENQIISKVTQLASKEGYPGFIIEKVYRTLLIQTKLYEQQTQIIQSK